MAFCPHCGKPVTAQAVKCIACGKGLPAGKPQQAQRFKGTMLLTPAVPAAPQGGVPDAPPAPRPVAAPPPAAPPAPAAAGAAPPRPSKLKATMIGTGISDAGGPPAAPAARSAMSAPSVREPAASAGATVSEGAPPLDDSLADTHPRPEAAGAEPPVAVATQAEGTASSPRAAPKVFTGDLSGPVRAAQQRAAPANAKLLILIAIVGLILIAATGYGTARYLDLL